VQQDVGKFMQIFRAACAATDRVGSITELSVAMAVLASLSAAFVEGRSMHALVSNFSKEHSL